MTNPTPFIKLTTIPAHATEEEARAIIWAAWYETQAELAERETDTDRPSQRPEARNGGQE